MAAANLKSGSMGINSRIAQNSEPLVRIAPGADGVSIWSSALFGGRQRERIGDFLARVFSVAGVSSVEIDRSRSFARVLYDAETGVDAVWRRLSQALKARTDPQSANTIEAQDLYLDVPRGSIRVGRIGTTLSTWQLRSQSGTTISLSHPALFNRRDIAYRLENLLSTIPGVERYKSSPIASSVAIRFNPRLLNAERLVRQLEKAWPRLLQGLDGPPSTTRFVAAGGLFALAFTGQYLVPALGPVALAAVAIYGAPNVINAGKQIRRGRIGLPLLYTTIMAFTLLSGLPISSAVMAVLMQFWPHLTHRTFVKNQRQLFAAHRQQATWARVASGPNLEIEVDTDKLRKGDLVIVRGGETIPVDGIIVEGLAAIDQEALTGAVGAQDKTVGDVVYSGTFVRDGHLTVQVEKAGIHTVSAFIASQLPNGKVDGLPSAMTVEYIANRNAKPALALAALNLLAGGLRRQAQALVRPDYATGPRLSVQLAALHDVVEGLQRGILFREIGALDHLPATDIYVFDEAPVLERKKIEVAEVISAGIVSADTVLGYAAAAFPPAQNARAIALQAEANKYRTPIPAIFQRERHAGAIRYRDKDAHLLEIAAPAYIEAAGIDVPKEVVKKTALARDAEKKKHSKLDHAEPFLRPLWVIRDKKVLGVILFRQGEAEAIEVIKTLKRRNRRARFVFFSSQPRHAAEAIAHHVGIRTVFSGLDQAGKVRALKRLGPRTIWLGDGAAPEAAPVIEASTVSVSTSGAATAPSDKADIVLLQPGLGNLVPLRQLGRSHRARIAADYKIIYTANLLGPVGGFVSTFGSLEVGLTSNIGTALVFLRNWLELRDLSARVEARRAKLLSSVHVETQPHLPQIAPHAEEEFVKTHSLDEAMEAIEPTHGL